MKFFWCYVLMSYIFILKIMRKLVILLLAKRNLLYFCFLNYCIPCYCPYWWRWLLSYRFSTKDPPTFVRNDNAWNKGAQNCRTSIPNALTTNTSSVHNIINIQDVLMNRWMEGWMALTLKWVWISQTNRQSKQQYKVGRYCKKNLHYLIRKTAAIIRNNAKKEPDVM